MTAQLAPAPVFRSWDNLGFPLVGGKLFTYAAGTTTPQATYVDSTQTTPNTNPVILNFRGEAFVWLNPLLSYKFVLQDAFGNLIWTEDNIQGAIGVASNIVPSTTNTFTLGTPTITFANGYFGPNGTPVFDPVSGNIGYYARTAAEVAAGVTPASFVYAPTPFIDVRRYGWSASNTATQNAAALTQAIAVSQAFFSSGNYGGTIQLPSGTFALNPVTLPAYTIVRGTGRRSTILQWNSSSSVALFTLGGTAGTVYYSPGLSDVSVQLTGTQGTIVLLQGTVGAEVARLYLEGETITSSRSTIGVSIDGSNASAFFNRVSDVECNHLHNGFVQTTTGSQQPTQNYFSNISGNGDVGTDTSSQGIVLGNGSTPAGTGQGSVYNCFDLEFYGIGVHAASVCGTAAFLGGRWEGNTNEAQFDNNSGPQIFLGCTLNPATIINNTGVLLNQYVGCFNGSFQPVENFHTPTQFSANALTDVPVTIECFTGQTSDVLQLKNASNAVIGGIDATAQLRMQTVRVTQPATSGSAGQLTFGNATAASATAGTNGAVPAQVAGYLIFDDGGTKIKIPYFLT
jgi:hypothetical protein